MVNFQKVEEALEEAQGIAWDSCHKIYVLLDKEQVSIMRIYEYEYVYDTEDMSKEEMLDRLIEWYDDSCNLRFIQSIRTDYVEPNDGFEDLIEQFAE
jgi:hypothetical protein